MNTTTGEGADQFGGFGLGTGLEDCIFEVVRVVARGKETEGVEEEGNYFALFIYRRPPVLSYQQLFFRHSPTFQYFGTPWLLMLR